MKQEKTNFHYCLHYLTIQLFFNLESLIANTKLSFQSTFTILLILLAKSVT